MRERTRQPDPEWLPRGVKTVASQANPGWFERFKRAVWEVINFPNPPRVHIDP